MILTQRKPVTDGSSPIIKLKDATGSLTVGETTYNFSKVEAHIDSKKGTINIQGKLRGTKPGEVVLRGTITGLTLDNGKVNGTFQVSLAGKLEQKGGSKNRVQLNLKGSVQLTF
ncbi:hypothetical protein HY009_06140 [Candidatus Acetothermia bacterium]|nr:hypothetical protein [Candidatus Acetothermia bacterium]